MRLTAHSWTLDLVSALGTCDLDPDIETRTGLGIPLPSNWDTPLPVLMPAGLNGMHWLDSV